MAASSSSGLSADQTSLDPMEGWSLGSIIDLKVLVLVLQCAPSDLSEDTFRVDICNSIKMSKKH